MTLQPRKQHWLRRNKGCRVPSNWLFVAVDCQETKLVQDATVTHYTFDKAECINVRINRGEVRNRSQRTCWTRQDYWQLVYSSIGRNRPLYVISPAIRHGASATGVWNEVNTGTITTQIVTLKTGCEIISCRCSRGRFTLLGVGNFLDLDLARYTDCGQRVNAVADAMLSYIGWIKDKDWGNFSWTAAGQAMALYRHRFLNQPIHIHSSDRATQLERCSYRGGRCEAFYWGRTEEQLFMVDVNGLFPAVMYGNKYPVRVSEYEQCPGRLAFERNLERWGCIARVTLDARANEYPVKVSSRIEYCRGRYVTTLAKPELLRCVRSGELVNVGLVAWYYEADIFTKYVDYMWGIRCRAKQCGDTLLAKTAKRMLVSLYGKFGQRIRPWEECDTDFCPVEGGVWLEITDGKEEPEWWRSIAGNTAREMGPQEGDNSFPAIAAYVTSYARVFMDKLRSQAGERNVFMQYVDSLIVNYEGYINLGLNGHTGSDKLGGIRLASKSLGATIYGPHDYQWQGRPVICGIPEEAVQVDGDKFRFTRHYTGGSRSNSNTLQGGYAQEVVAKLKREKPTERISNGGWLQPCQYQD